MPAGEAGGWSRNACIRARLDVEHQVGAASVAAVLLHQAMRKQDACPGNRGFLLMVGGREHRAEVKGWIVVSRCPGGAGTDLRQLANQVHDCWLTKEAQELGSEVRG